MVAMETGLFDFKSFTGPMWLPNKFLSVSNNSAICY